MSRSLIYNTLSKLYRDCELVVDDNRTLSANVQVPTIIVRYSVHRKAKYVMPQGMKEPFGISKLNESLINIDDDDQMCLIQDRSLEVDISRRAWSSVYTGGGGLIRAYTAPIRHGFGDFKYLIAFRLDPELSSIVKIICLRVLKTDAELKEWLKSIDDLEI